MCHIAVIDPGATPATPDTSSLTFVPVKCLSLGLHFCLNSVQKLPLSIAGGRFLFNRACEAWLKHLSPKQKTGLVVSVTVKVPKMSQCSVPPEEEPKKVPKGRGSTKTAVRPV